MGTNSKPVKLSPDCERPEPDEEAKDLQRAREAYLVGKTVKGILMRRRGGYFIKWNEEMADAVFVSEECVLRDIGDKRQKGLVAVVKCVIEKLGPAYVEWTRQHPSSSKIELVQRYWNSWHRRQSQKGQRPPLTLTRKTQSSRGIRPGALPPLSRKTQSSRGIHPNRKRVWRSRRVTEVKRAESASLSSQQAGSTTSSSGTPSVAPEVSRSSSGKSCFAARSNWREAS